MRYYTFLICLILLTGNFVFSQKEVRFPASDSLIVTADFYSGSPGDPYILLFHQENSSRGEYTEIAPRFVKLGYNCLAVDLRAGKEMNYVINETARYADSMNITPSLFDCMKDIEGAIDFAIQNSLQPVVLLGSSFSASLVLLAAHNNPSVKAVMAFSPGEFFLPQISVKDSLSGFNKPVFIAGTKSEYPYLSDLAEEIPVSLKRLYAPGDMEGERGARSLWKNDPAFREYWLAVIMFTRSIMQETP
ncbi:MAG: hypothetical protein GXO83_09620 [Chlorobi bacterium]|nr:hypothetical protein [Chlorobiota bacterium]